MMRKTQFYWLAGTLAAVGVGLVGLFWLAGWGALPVEDKTAPAEEEALAPTQAVAVATVPGLTKELAKIEFVGPRDNLPKDAPTAYGFWSLAIPAPGILSRSGQPLISEFGWLAEKGWQGVVNLRIDGERGEVGDDALLPGFNQLGLNYLHLPIVDGHPPTLEQAQKFLNFVNDQNNQPAHVHCRGGIGRAGTMVALYRYAVQEWPMDQAIEESRAFKGGVSETQKAWLQEWAQTNGAGSYAVNFH